MDGCVWKRLGLVRAVMHEQPFHAASFAQSRGTVACVERGYGDGEKGVVRWLERNERAGRPSMGQVIRATYAAFELPVARNAYRTWVVGCYRPTWCTAYLTTRICLGIDPILRAVRVYTRIALKGLAREATRDWPTQWKKERKKKWNKRDSRRSSLLPSCRSFHLSERSRHRAD